MSPISPSWIRCASCCERPAVAGHQSHSHFQVLRHRLFAQLEQAAGSGPIGRQRLFHEDVEILADGVAEVDPAEGQRRGEDRHVARFEAVHGLLVAVEADKLPLGGNIDPVAELLLQVAVAAAEAILEDVGQGHELQALVGRQRVGRRAGAASAAADQDHLDRVVLPRVDAWNDRAGQGRSGGDLAGGFQELATRRGMALLVMAHERASF